MWNSSWWRGLAATLRDGWIARLTRYYDWRYPDAAAVPRVGQEVYAYGESYLSHGEDDFAGGRARVARVTVDPPSSVWVEFEEQPGTRHNWEYLGPKQNTLRAIYGRAKAHPDPDHRPAFNRWD
jgi:hypothetical protein